MEVRQTTGVLDRLSIAQKIVGLFAINVLVAIVISAMSIFYLDIISHELEQVAHEDIPLTRHLSHINSTQLEQAIHLERAIRYGELMSLGQDAAKELNTEIKYFDRLGHSVELALEDIQALLTTIFTKEHTTAVTEELQKVQDAIVVIETAHNEIDVLAKEVFTLLKAGNLHDAEAKVKILTKKEDTLDKQTHDVLLRFEAFTAESLLKANEHEIEAKNNLMLVSAAFVLLASILSFLVIRSVSSPLRKLKIALISLQDGQNSSLPAFQEGTELGDIFNSVSLIGNQFDAINRTQCGLYIDLTGDIEFANENFLDFINYTLDDLQGKSFASFVDSSLSCPEPWETQWESIVHGVPKSGEYGVKNRQGEIRWMQATFNPIVGLHGRTNRVVLYAIDITEEVILREEIAMISLVAAETDNSVVITDADERIEYVNEGFTRITGYTAEEVRGKKPGSFLQGENTDKDTINRIRQKLAGCEPFYDEVLNYNKRGEPYWVSLAINPVFNDQGELIRFVSIQGEVTENKIRNLENERGMHESVAVLKALAQGKLNCAMTGEYNGTFGEISQAINETVTNLVDVVQRIRTVASTVDTAAREINTGNADLAQRSENAAARLQETTSNMEEITTTVAQNADNSAQANKLALEAHQEAERGGKVVGVAVNAMVDINESSKKIADITGVIDDIAFQTNLLALNASVEAARAGEQGRGFAVVASEVRNLAGRSADAAKEIKELISKSVQRVENGVELVNETGETLESIVAQVKKVADIVAEIYSSSQEQADGVRQIHNAILEIDDATQQNASLVEEASAASQSTTKQAENLIKLISYFDTETLPAKTLAADDPLTIRPANDRSFNATAVTAIKK